MGVFNWECPHCSQPVTMSDADVQTGLESINIRTAAVDEKIGLVWNAYKCPNPRCHKFTLDVDAGFGAYVDVPNSYRRVKLARNTDGRLLNPVGIGSFRFSPRVGKPLSDFVALVVKADYEEACLIKDLSPKAAATLCRRALQGMIRDFWKISKNQLWEELLAIKDMCDPDIYDAMTSLKAIGNIGAHPERDINLVVDVDEGEVESLLELIHLLDKEWYVARQTKASRLAAVVSIANAKQAMKSSGA